MEGRRKSGFSATKPVCETIYGLRSPTVPQGTFPHDSNSPSVLPEECNSIAITYNVVHEFRFPELHSGCRCGGKAASRMPMPETPMNKAHGLVFRKDQVRFSRKRGPVQPISEASCVQGLAQDHLGLGVPAPDTRHHARPCREVNDIRHGRVRIQGMSVSERGAVPVRS